MGKIVFEVEMTGRIHPAFDAKTFARGIAYRASRWCESAQVKGANVAVEVKSEKKE
ncbi:hypothetical protein [Laceyella putida]|uniref:Uncharacterized protein n=2 Tax=Laceyella putida TaxID=110101 RepID=A0ABW2RR48_9BACL